MKRTSYSRALSIRRRSLSFPFMFVVLVARTFFLDIDTTSNEVVPWQHEYASPTARGGIPVPNPPQGSVSFSRNVTSCAGKDGILHIQSRTKHGAFGHIIFHSIMNQLIYAETFNLVPVVHLGPAAPKIYDPVAAHHLWRSDEMVQHPTNLTVLDGWKASTWKQYTKQSCPSHLQPPESSNASTTTHLQLSGNGLWSLYFAPIPRKPLDPVTCSNKPYIVLDWKQEKQANIHCRWGVRSYRYATLPSYLLQPELTFSDWIRPYRQKGREMVRKGYYQIQTSMLRLFERTMPSWMVQQQEEEGESQGWQKAAAMDDGNGIKGRSFPNDFHHSCLSVHVRHSDKANGRTIIEVSQFLPFVNAYLQHCPQQQHQQQQQAEQEASNSTIYPINHCRVFLATDSKKVIEEIEQSWPASVVERIEYQKGIIRSSNEQAVFDMVSNKNHHQTNQEIMLDIMGLASCKWMLHGHSAVTEGALFLNSRLQSINLDDPDHMDIRGFQALLQAG